MGGPDGFELWKKVEEENFVTRSLKHKTDKKKIFTFSNQIIKVLQII